MTFNKLCFIIGSTALGGPCPPQANVTNDFYPGQPSTIFYRPASLRLPPSRRSISISVGHVLVDLHGLFIIFFLTNSFSSIRAT